jgi:hypothetical protein
VRIHKWPTLSAPVLGYAYEGQHVAVLAWYSDFDEILYRGREAWISSRYVYSDGLSYGVRVPAPTH